MHTFYDFKMQKINRQTDKVLEFVRNMPKTYAFL